MKFKTNIVHKTVTVEGRVFYRCNQAVGELSKEQLIEKTNYWKVKRRITCKNCRKWRNRR